MRHVSWILIAASLPLACGGGGGKPGGDGSSVVDTAAARALANEKDEPPMSIDPDREEIIRTGTPAERLLGKYELLMERIRLERKEGVFHTDRALAYGLQPIAGDHHELLASGDIDTTLTIAFVHLAEFVLKDYILRDMDPDGVEAKKQLGEVRAMLPKHETQAEETGD